MLPCDTCVGIPCFTYSISPREGKTGTLKGGREGGKREGNGRHGFVIFRRVKLVLWQEEGKISSGRKWSG